jgi:hypothetical protein
MGNKVSEVRREIMPGVDLVVKGKGVQQATAVLAEVLVELASEAGGELRFSMNEPATVERFAQRLRQKGIDPSTGEWIF